MIQRDLEALPPPIVQEHIPSRPKPRRRRWLGFLTLALIAGLCYAGYRYYEAGRQQRQAAQNAQAARMANRPVPVAAVPAHRGDVPIYLRGLGNVQAFNTVNVKSRVDGPIVSINYTEGQYVKEGDVLVEIDPRPYQVQLEQTKGQLARDQAQLNDSQVNLKRYQQLWNAQVIPRQQLDTQAAQVGQFSGVIEADKANVSAAELNLSFTKVRAPISGRIGLRMVDIGNIVHASDQTALVVITQMQPIAVLFTIPADNLPPVLEKLRAGAKLGVDAYDRADINRIATGTLLTVDNQIDPNTGTSRLKAIFGNKESALFPNQFVNCRLLLAVRHGAVIVPAPAIQRGPQGPYVYVVKPDGTVSLRNITTAVTEGGDTEVATGLAPGDMVVTDGQDKLREGVKVQVQGAPAAAPAARRRSRG